MEQKKRQNQTSGGRGSFWERNLALQEKRDSRSLERREGRPVSRRDTQRSTDRREVEARSLDRRARLDKRMNEVNSRAGAAISNKFTDSVGNSNNPRGSEMAGNTSTARGEPRFAYDSDSRYHNRNNDNSNNSGQRHSNDAGVGGPRHADTNNNNWNHSRPVNYKDSPEMESRSRYQVDKRRWGWAQVSTNNQAWQSRIPQDADYMEMSSLETLGTSHNTSSSSGESHHYEPSLHSIYSSRHYLRKLQPSTPRVSRSRSISRTRSTGHGGHYAPSYPYRTQSFSSISDNMVGGTSLNLKPFKSNLFSQNQQKSPYSYSMIEINNGYVSSRSERDETYRSASGIGGVRRSPGRGVLLDLKNITINDCEIQKDDALVIVEMSRKALVKGESEGLTGAALYGKVAGWIKDSVEQELGEGTSWQCVVGAKGVFGCCLSPFPNCYFNFDVANVTILIFRG